MLLPILKSSQPLRRDYGVDLTSDHQTTATPSFYGVDLSPNHRATTTPSVYGDEQSPNHQPNHSHAWWRERSSKRVRGEKHSQVAEKYHPP
ncbi:hypothetical protein K1719_018849 [Acacia pycnantha]|nr:hypothetical protein K1719_018849 [Acacia pycnantha]